MFVTVRFFANAAAIDFAPSSPMSFPNWQLMVVKITILYIYDLTHWKKRKSSRFDSFPMRQRTQLLPLSNTCCLRVFVSSIAPQTGQQQRNRYRSNQYSSRLDCLPTRQRLRFRCDSEFRCLWRMWFDFFLFCMQHRWTLNFHVPLRFTTVNVWFDCNIAANASIVALPSI